MKITFFILSIVILNKYYPKKVLDKKIQKSVSVLKRAIEDVVKRK